MTCTSSLFPRNLDRDRNLDQKEKGAINRAPTMALNLLVVRFCDLHFFPAHETARLAPPQVWRVLAAIMDLYTAGALVYRETFSRVWGRDLTPARLKRLSRLLQNVTFRAG